MNVLIASQLRQTGPAVSGIKEGSGSPLIMNISTTAVRRLNAATTPTIAAVIGEAGDPAVASSTVA